MTKRKVLTPDEVKAQLQDQGITITQWAKDHGYTRNAVYRVLNGFDKAKYGKAHEIAVKLGLKAQPQPDHAAA
ncbi:DNA-binding protein [Marinobacterium litorale]|uniref:DNA-binding protein n=1 Tax=Marinobacterium litorale TaxID=404770 RepID=UPI000411A50A|nr:DNA-binding protein [Marinobacterium litorale]